MTNFKINNLKNSNSPYLIQHANNPINWQEWNDGVLNYAREKNKLLVISIGYTTCHWCHEMEKEVFENKEVARFMNEHFVAIKVDREVHPEVDHLYMQSLQLMIKQGGWPLNIIALPNKMPVWGCTFLKAKPWLSALMQIKALFEKDPNSMQEYADTLKEGVSKLQLPNINNKELKKKVDFELLLNKWKNQLDYTYGGDLGIPKFMMPNQHLFLLKYAHIGQDNNLNNYLKLSLKKIEGGGIHDHIEGGFSRYALDQNWHVPHFEKMLYDNLQLINLYHQAYILFQEKSFKKTYKKTLAFIDQQLSDSDYLWFTALDADSLNIKEEREEGAYYTWKKEELQELLKEKYELFASYFNINPKGYWENGNYILFKSQSISSLAKSFNLSKLEAEKQINECLQTLKASKAKRAKPQLDDKKMLSLNAMAITTYLNVYKTTQEQPLLMRCQKAIDRILQLNYDGNKLYKELHEHQDKKAGSLEDYAFFIQALLSMHEVSLKPIYLKLSEALIQYCFKNFKKDADIFFYYSEIQNEDLFIKPIALRDNVVPSANAIMSENLHKLALLTGKTAYQEHFEKMQDSISSDFMHSPSDYSQWLQNQLKRDYPFFLVKTNENLWSAFSKRKALINFYRTTNTSQKSTKNTVKEEVLICTEKACLPPVYNTQEAIKLLLGNNY
ncbi:thioredoxin domain-containing protein [uncultured Mesonia sp.]|uniref:thioredoxin domain-containing protein n=1 Tax=uncultured Mesonia sp. TaxID=399731 RepID=UPI00374F3A90